MTPSEGTTSHLAVPGTSSTATPGKSRSNSLVSDAASNDTFGSWLHADHVVQKSGSEEIPLSPMGLGATLAIPVPKRSSSAHSEASGVSGMSTLSLSSESRLVSPSSFDGLGALSPSEMFGITAEEMHHLLEAKSLERLAEKGGVLGLVRRLRSNPAEGISENRDKQPLHWQACSVRETEREEIAIRRKQLRLLSKNMSITIDPPTQPEDPHTVVPPIFIFQEPEGMDEEEKPQELALSPNVSIYSESKEPATLDHHIATHPPIQGHSDDPFHARKQIFGDNVMPSAKLLTLWDFAREALKDKTLIVLIIAAFADVAIGIYKTAFAEVKDPLGFVDGLAIIFAVVVIVLISSVNDFRKQAQFNELSDFSLSLSKVQVIRNGTSMQIKTSELLVGDICHIQAGDLVAADGLLLSGFNLSADESSMTGESVALTKDTTHDPFLFSGTKLVNGVGKMVVIATGRNSMNGRLLEALESAESEETPLQVKLGGLADLIAKFGTYTAVGMFVLLVIVYVIFHHNGTTSTVSIVNDIINLVIIAVTLVVVAVPEGLPLAVTISLAHATLKMLKDNNLVRHLRACETMGNATTICSDKTGTLTQNRMQVVVGVVGCRAFGMENLSTKSRQEETLFRRLTQRGEGGSVMVPGAGSVETLGESLGVVNEADSAFAGIPEVVLDHIARGINVNTTAEEVVVDNDSENGGESSTSRKTTTTAIEIKKPNATEFIGSKTEIALLEFTKLRMGKEYAADRASTELIEVIPFSSDRKRMSTVVKISAVERTGQLEAVLFGEGAKVEKRWLFCKGAAELVVKLCDRYVNAEGKVVPLTDQVRSEFESQIESMATCALRTICMAFKPVLSPSSHTATTTDPTTSSSDDTNLILAGIVGIRDPIRPEVPAAVADCQRAGVVVRMVTGDNMTTARSIAKIAGILPDLDDEMGDEYAVMDGPTFRKLSPEMMDVVIPQLKVLARSSPLDKQILVNNLKRLGETVAVTGDGTNDAPALKSADVGFSMGIAGTEMAKEASDIILLDDNFASLSKAIIWGRSVYDSVRKFLQFQLTVNIVAVVLTVVSSFMTAVFSETKTPLSALTAVQLLWVNLIMDTFAALALATDPPTPDLLNRAPARKSDPLISYDMWKMISSQSVYQIVVCLVLYCVKVDWVDGRMNVIVAGGGAETFTPSYELMGTVVFNTFVFCQLFNELNCRVIGRELNIFKNISQNHLFTGIVGGSVIVQVLIVEFGGPVFKTVRLGAEDWLLCVGLAALSIPLGVLVRVTPDWFKRG
ncbi:hypothetical protein HDU98_003076 [Podochytrium sp. JEL0797]|nr:hypothetical protein HDU98_003076 [Podochytrium sp. JEL0797]